MNCAERQGADAVVFSFPYHQGSTLRTFFAPAWFTEHMGFDVIAFGAPAVASWASLVRPSLLSFPSLGFSFPSSLSGSYEHFVVPLVDWFLRKICNMAIRSSLIRKS
jgi:hypothetical protein